MKKILLFLSLFLTCYSFSQSVNDYKAVIIPLKYDFLKSENQYRLQTLTKVNLGKAGFQAFYSNETIPAEFNERCSLLYVDIKNEKAFLATKLFITFKDCTGTIIFQSEIGKSKEKEYQTEVSYILRSILEHKFDIPVLEETTQNIMYLLKPFALTKDLTQQIQSTLNFADFVKYAKGKGMAHQHEKAMELLKNLVELLKEQDAE